MESERMSFDEKTGRFEALGSFADMMKSLSMHLHDPNPEVALRSRMLMAMMPGLDEAMKEEARRQTPATSVAIAGLDVATTFLGNMVRHMTDDEKDVPKGMRVFGKAMQDHMRRAAQLVEEKLRGQSGPRN
jgi:hypothetical protein